jgi:Phosphotransferase enzyme family
VDSVHNIGWDIYRLIVTRRDASELLLVRCESGWSLPSVEIQRGQRIAEQLTTELYAHYACRGYCLFLPTSAGELARCAVMEASQNDEMSPGGTCWIPLAEATSLSTESADAYAIIEKSIKELDTLRNAPRLAPFAKPGWLAELTEWVGEQVTPLGLRLTGNYTQLNASPAFSLVRLETNDSAVWFKAAGEPNRHERPVAACLARLFPEYVPRLLGVHASWNGWLTEEVSGTRLDPTAEFSAWSKAAEDLAHLQILSIRRQAELLEGQCKNLRLPRLVAEIDPFLDRMREFMAAQEKTTPAPLTDTELARLGTRLKRACSSLCDARLPDTLGHLDFNPGNIFIAPDRCVFLDWAEACVTSPLITFEFLREHFQRARGNSSTIEHLVNSYRGPWRSVVPPADWNQAIAVSPLVAVFAYAVACSAWRCPETRGQRSHAGYFRSLTRRMYREAEGISARSEPCFA